jgi:hypothetical protein
LDLYNILTYEYLTYLIMGDGTKTGKGLTLKTQSFTIKQLKLKTQSFTIKQLKLKTQSFTIKT